MFEVKDGARTLQFSGKLLGESSSYRPNSNRWIEFRLYRTQSGSYVLSRIGVSLIYHGAACPLVKRYQLQEIKSDLLNEKSVPCEQCYPDKNAKLVFPEKDRHWAQVTEEPSAILDALYKFDDYGSKYLTYVAQKLLEEAGKNDSNIEKIYKFEIIP